MSKMTDEEKEFQQKTIAALEKLYPNFPLKTTPELEQLAQKIGEGSALSSAPLRRFNREAGYPIVPENKNE